MDAEGAAARGAEDRERFLANMGHALRTPLSAVAGLLDLLSATDLDPLTGMPVLSGTAVRLAPAPATA